MKAALLTAIGQPLELADVPRPALSPDEVLVETRTCGICRTDIHIQDGAAYVPSLPHIPGHEPAGVVCEVGERVRSLKVGDRVVPHLFLVCGRCPSCFAGNDAQCENVAGIIGVTTAGGFAEYFKAPAENLLVIPPGVPFDVGGLISCAVITAVHAYRRSRLSVGDVALVIGAGGIGQILTQILKQAGVRVAALARSAESLRLVEKSGADLVLRSDDKAAERVLDFTAGRGAACAFECVGLSATMKTAAQCVTRGGQIIVIGEEPEFPAIDTIQIAQRELEIIGSRNGSKGDALDAIEWVARGVIRPAVVQRLPLEKINEGLRLVRTGAAHGRVVVTLHNEA
jgi:propanol-preferring alcohol dehydrogenase